MVNIRDFGAVGDGVTLDTAAIQAAIDACAAAGGGRVVVPAGTWKSGTIWLKSHVELHLEIGATILASDNMDDYNDVDAFEQNMRVVSNEGWVGKHLLIALEAEDVAISGLGTFDGNCYAFVTDYFRPDLRYGWWRSGQTKLKDPVKMRPGQLLSFFECRRVDVSGVTVRNSPCWSVYLLGCECVRVHGIKVFNPHNMLNSDGIDIDSSRRVTVSDCIIDTGDDAITLRCCEQKLKNKNMHCEYVTVTNCVLSSTISGFRIGVGTGTIRHVRINNLAVDRVRDLLLFNTSYNGKGQAMIEDVNLCNVSCTDADRLICISADAGAAVRNVTVENVRIEATLASVIRAAEGTVDNVTLRDVEISYRDRYEDVHDQHHFIVAANVSRLTLDNVTCTGTFAEFRSAFEAENCESLVKKDCNF